MEIVESMSETSDPGQTATVAPAASPHQGRILPSLLEARAFVRPPAHPGPGRYYDSLYGFTPTDAFLRDAIDLPVVQRLRHLRQLSTLHLRYPGANHSRLEHAVGATHLAGLLHDSLRTRFNRGLSAASKAAVQLAALFHDLGHGPYSHLYDSYAQRRSVGSANPFRSHDARTSSLITNPDTGIPDLLHALRSAFEKPPHSDPNAFLLTPE